MPHLENKFLLQALNHCAEHCDHCTNACLDEDDVKILTRCIRLNIDCSQACRFVASVVSRGSERASGLLSLCADMCEECARECDTHTNMSHCTDCAQACRECAEACRKGSQLKAA